ncbi:MAG: TonB-dependent receptor [Deltaproteobacteria bacterium]|jgi:iron complex outermembrane receptor protein|nr:TonB-dependent receptor [Deltaproteobacteria bacterium]
MGKINRGWLIFILLLTALVTELGSIAKAQEMSEIEEIEIRSAIRREELQSTSATVLSNKDISDRIYISPLYMLRQAPGVRINEFNEQGVASSIQIRGFSGGHGGEVGFYFDGIPLNDSGHADNYSDTTILIPLEIESIEVIKGPVSALYGRGNAAGTAAYQGIKRGDFSRFLIRMGLYKTFDFQGVVAKDDGKLHHVYAFQGYHTDTWRDNTNWKRLNLSARWTYDVSDNFEISLNLRAALAKWDSALQALSWLDPKKGSDDGSGQGNMVGGHRDRFDARLFMNYFINQNSQVSFYFFATSLENNLAEFYYKSPVGPNNNYVLNEQDGNDQTGKREAYGTGLAYSYKGAIANRDFSLTVGADYLWEKQKRDQYRLHWGYGNKHFEHYNDTEYTLNTISFFGETNYQIIDKLKIRVGGRYDRLWGDVTFGPDHNASGIVGPSHFNSKKMGFFSPKFGLLFTPTEIIEIYANYGKGFNIPGLNSAQFFSQHQLEFTEREQWELGFRASPFNWLDFGSVYYLADTSNDIQANPDKNDELENVGKTRRRGLETYVKFYPIQYLTISADYTYQDVKYRKNLASPHLNGRRYTSIPRHIFNAEVAYAPLEGWGGRATFNWNADMMLRDDPTAAIHQYYRAEDYGTLDMQVNYRFNKKYKISLDVLNVFNDRPRQAVPNPGGYFAYWPANPTAVYLTVEMEF